MIVKSRFHFPVSFSSSAERGRPHRISSAASLLAKTRAVKINLLATLVISALIQKTFSFHDPVVTAAGILKIKFLQFSYLCYVTHSFESLFCSHVFSISFWLCACLLLFLKVSFHSHPSYLFIYQIYTSPYLETLSSLLCIVNDVGMGN